MKQSPQDQQWAEALPKRDRVSEVLDFQLQLPHLPAAPVPKQSKDCFKCEYIVKNPLKLNQTQHAESMKIVYESKETMKNFKPKQWHTAWDIWSFNSSLILGVIRVPLFGEKNFLSSAASFSMPMLGLSTFLYYS
jgi:hypothetical protein